VGRPPLALTFATKPISISIPISQPGIIESTQISQTQGKLGRKQSCKCAATCTVPPVKGLFQTVGVESWPGGGGGGGGGGAEAAKGPDHWQL